MVNKFCKSVKVWESYC